MKRFIFPGICSLLILACQNQGKHNKASLVYSVIDQTKDMAFQSKVCYANRFTITNHEGYKHIVVFDPWNNDDTLASYVLYPKGEAVPAHLPPHEFLIPVPVEEIATMSTTHIGTLDLLHEVDKVTGVSKGSQIQNPVIKKKFENGRIPELGGHSNNNFEEIINLSPELLMKTGFDNIRKIDERIIEAGIPVAYNIEWMESHMLGRAEWIKFSGAFFAKNEMADSIFNQIEASYNQLAQLAASVQHRPKVMTDRDFKGTWYTPGGNSYLAQLIRQSGGDYHFKNDSSKGSLPVSFEVILDNFTDADVWLMQCHQSTPDLASMDERYHLFKPVKEGRVYNFDNRVNESGGNDYWETGVTRPDIILKDLIKIIHPELLPDHELYYYRKIPKSIDKVSE